MKTCHRCGEAITYLAVYDREGNAYCGSVCHDFNTIPVVIEINDDNHDFFEVCNLN